VALDLVFQRNLVKTHRRPNDSLKTLHLTEPVLLLTPQVLTL
jgi:hypothetical protein